jgi:hypothetical protein
MGGGGQSHEQKDAGGFRSQKRRSGVTTEESRGAQANNTEWPLFNGKYIT